MNLLWGIKIVNNRNDKLLKQAHKNFLYRIYTNDWYYINMHNQFDVLGNFCEIHVIGGTNEIWHKHNKKTL